MQTGGRGQQQEAQTCESSGVLLPQKSPWGGGSQIVANRTLAKPRLAPAYTYREYQHDQQRSSAEDTTIRPSKKSERRESQSIKQSMSFWLP